jgi:hypothetical protein
MAKQLKLIKNGENVLKIINFEFFEDRKNAAMMSTSKSNINLDDVFQNSFSTFSPHQR